MNGIVTAVLEVFEAVGTWISETIPTFVPIFYSAESGLTFVGVTLLMSLGFSVVFLLIGLLQRFLSFRG